MILLASYLIPGRDKKTLDHHRRRKLYLHPAQISYVKKSMYSSRKSSTDQGPKKSNLDQYKLCLVILLPHFEVFCKLDDLSFKFTISGFQHLEEEDIISF